MATTFQIPKRMASFPGKASIYRVETLPSKKLATEYLIDRMTEISPSLGFSIVKPAEDEGHVYNQEGPLNLRFFKASGSFLFFNRDLTAQTLKGLDIISPKKARNLAVELLTAQKLLHNVSPAGKLFQTYYGGPGYTVAQTAEIDQSGGDWKVDESDPYHTEIRSHFGYLLGGKPVFGPGAKTIVSYVGNQLSEELHYWRKPIEIVNELEIVSPVTAINRLCKHKYFTKVDMINKKYPGLTSGRFHDDVELGYLATPPFNNQRFYLPVFKIRGTFESRIKVSGSKVTNYNKEERTFRYDFVHYVSALHGNEMDAPMKDFKSQIIL